MQRPCVCQERAWLLQETEEKKNAWLDLESKEGIVGNKVKKGHKDME